MTIQNMNLIYFTLKSVLKNSTDFIFIKDINLVYVACSKSFAVDCVGLNDDEDVIGKTDFEIFKDEALARKYRHDDEELLSFQTPMLEYKESYPDKLGRKRYCLTTKYVIFNDIGEPQGIYGICKDITNIVESELAQKEQKNVLNQHGNIFKALKGIYKAILFFDFNKNSYSYITDTARTDIRSTSNNNLTEDISQWIKENIKPNLLNQYQKFLDLSTVCERLTHNGILTKEIQTIHYGWIRIYLVPMDYQDNHVTSCLCVTESINQEKLKEIEQSEALKREKHRAETDALTGLMNRGQSEYLLSQIMLEKRLGLFCMFDLNHFKQINDRYGHPVGDIVLKKIAKGMHKVFRHNDIVARFGGDEFVVFAQGITDIFDAKSCIERLLSIIEDESLIALNGEHIQISVGAVLINKETKMNFSSLFELCDSAMYKCKNNKNIGYYLYSIDGNLLTYGFHQKYDE